MSAVSIKKALNGEIPTGAKIRVQGWVRTRRDSKAGFSFISVHDGSCFNAIQVVAQADLPNYSGEIQKLTSGCSVICYGELVESLGRGQKFEIQASSVEVTGWIEDPDTYPIQPKQHSFEFLREVAHLRPRGEVSLENARYARYEEECDKEGDNGQDPVLLFYASHKTSSPH